MPKSYRYVSGSRTSGNVRLLKFRTYRDPATTGSVESKARSIWSSAILALDRYNLQDLAAKEDCYPAIIQSLLSDPPSTITDPAISLQLMPEAISAARDSHLLNFCAVEITIRLLTSEALREIHPWLMTRRMIQYAGKAHLKISHFKVSTSQGCKAEGIIFNSLDVETTVLPLLPKASVKMEILEPYIEQTISSLTPSGGPSATREQLDGITNGIKDSRPGGTLTLLYPLMGQNLTSDSNGPLVITWENLSAEPNTVILNLKTNIVGFLDDHGTSFLGADPQGQTKQDSDDGVLQRLRRSLTNARNSLKEGGYEIYFHQAPSPLLRNVEPPSCVHLTQAIATHDEVIPESTVIPGWFHGWWRIYEWETVVSPLRALRTGASAFLHRLLLEHDGSKKTKNLSVSDRIHLHRLRLHICDGLSWPWLAWLSTATSATRHIHFYRFFVYSNYGEKCAWASALS
ncbi:hypothetical protein TREMEDRAFT_60620 [Tremella mesenterica DSM 1558]|uniref:uncharacterized protein n=1 Tax=Tremella mesenterica (strain ATCC 24925 / CBS 8224 / DSM 1558 / NBRC 9311 / NRRL Y-6157 / RJB 2259-6 / UBC 559-6) TaxID=578456 RepID=UPI0003F49118|nr:uncharacterized protein TREMEDRAFT_60620 [Tremella mesenterica DSM 1558]EIW71702.1 hypothetical protein TREMEDRAFT_60620 [Tremella mesenterica DSM 1558]